MAGDATIMANKYAKRLDLAFKNKSFTDKYVNHDYTFDGVNSITVYGLTTNALTDYVLGSATAFGTPNTADDVIKTYTLSNHKKYNKFFDNYVLSKLGGAITVAKWIANQINQVVVPAVDIERITTAVAAATVNKHVIEFVAATFLDDLRTEAGRYFDLGVFSGVVAFMDSLALNTLKGQVQTLFSYTSSDIMTKRQFRTNLEGIDIIEIPTGYFPNALTHVAMWHPDAVLGTREWNSTRTKETESADGILAQGHLAFQTFIMEAKKHAVSVFVEDDG
jgi:hypothetical protein